MHPITYSVYIRILYSYNTHYEYKVCPYYFSEEDKKMLISAYLYIYFCFS